MAQWLKKLATKLQGPEFNSSDPCGAKRELTELMMFCKLFSDFHTLRVNILFVPKITDI